MDSLTHIVLGAAIGDRILGKSIGRKAAFYGALAKTAPDFDLFISGLTDTRKYILYHRSYTHSFFIELLAIFPLAWICHYFYKTKSTLNQWILLWTACLIGHSVVDMFTNYGTRLFLPFYNQPVSLNNMAIADIFLTLPITILVTWALFKKNDSIARRRLMVATLIYAVVYFDLSFVNKAIAKYHFKASFPKKEVRIMGSMTNPTLLNNFLWYAVFNDHRNTYTATYSLFQGKKPIKWTSYPIGQKNLQHFSSPDMATLFWFSQGFYLCRKKEDTLIYYLTKFGPFNLDADSLNEKYLYYYRLYKHNNVWQLDMNKPDPKDLEPRKALIQLGKHIAGAN